MNTDKFLIRIPAFAFAFLLCLSLVPVFSVHAESAPVSFSPLSGLSATFDSTSFDSYQSIATPIFKRAGYQYYATFSTYAFDGDPSSKSVYAFLYGTSTVQLCLVETGHVAYENLLGINLYLNTNNSFTAFITSVLEDHPDFRYASNFGGVQLSSLTDINIPLFDSFDDGIAALSDFIENGGSGGGHTLHEVTFSLPAGNVAFIDISGDDFNDMLISTSLALAGNGSSLNQTWGYVDSIPSSFSLPISGATNKIDWNGVGQATIFGGLRTRFQRSYTVNDSNGKFLVIVNPFYSADYANNLYNLNSSGNKVLYNSPVNVHLDQAVSYRIFGLNTQLGYQDGEWSIDTSSNGDSWSSFYDESTGVWSTTNDLTGLSGNPVNGGSNTVVGVENSVNDWLENIAHTISGFFNGAIGAVTTLVNAGSDFFRSIGGLYSWLPAPVYSVLISAAILAITIGVIKVFL